MDKQSGSRTQEELQFLCDQLGDLQFFQDYIKDNMADLLKRCVRFVQYKFYKKGDIIFEIDSQADNFYIIISGLIGVFVRPPELPNKKKKKKIQESNTIMVQNKNIYDQVMYTAQQSITSLKGLSQQEIQEETSIDLDNLEQETKQMSMIQLFDDQKKDKRKNSICITQNSSMTSIKDVLLKSRLSFSPTITGNSRHKNKQESLQQIEITSNNKIKLNKSITKFDGNKRQNTNTSIDRYKKSYTIIQSPSKQQDGTFFLTSKQEQQSSKVSIKIPKEKENEKEKTKETQKDKDDLTKIQRIYHFGETLTKVKDMETGTAFGELALVYNKERAATIVCMHDTHLAYIEKEQFVQIFSQKEQRKIQIQSEYFGKLPLFSNFSFQFLRDLFYNTTQLKFKKGDIVFLEDSVPEYVYIVKKGEFGVITLANCNQLIFIYIFQVFKQFDVQNQNEQNDSKRKNSIENKQTIPLFHKKKIKKKDFQVMSVGEQELIGDTDLILKVDRQFTLKCTSLEGELVQVKRDYFEDKVFKYEDTFIDLVKRCKNKQMNFDQNVQNIKQQLEISSNSIPQSILPKKERSFSNLFNESKINERRQSLSPFQDKNKQFGYRKKTKLHINIQNKLEVSLPQIQSQYTYTPGKINIRSSSQSPHITPSKSALNQQKEEDKILLSKQHQNQNEIKLNPLEKNAQPENNSILKYDNQEKKENNNKYFTPRNSKYMQNQQKRQFDNNQIKSSINKYEEEFQIKNNYYEPSSLPCTGRNRDVNDQRSLEVSFDNSRNSPVLQKQSQTLDIHNQSRNQTFVNTINKVNKQSMISPILNQETSNNILIQYSNRNKFIQNASTNEEINKSHIQNSNSNFRSISQNDFLSIQDNTNHQIGFYNNKQKKIVKIKRQNSKDLSNVQSQQCKEDESKRIQLDNSKVEQQESKQVVMPDLNLKQNIKVPQFKVVQPQSPKNNKQNGSHTERIASVKKKEKDFMDSSYGYFKMQELVAKEILTERNIHKPLLMEIKANEHVRNELTKKKSLSYHQQQMSQQEKILQTLIFSKKKVKNHFFQKVMGNQISDAINQQDCLKNFKSTQAGEKQQKQNVIDLPLNKNNQNKQYRQNYNFVNRNFDQQNNAFNQINKIKNDELSITETNSASKQLNEIPIYSEKKPSSSSIQGNQYPLENKTKISGQIQKQVFSPQKNQNEKPKEQNSQIDQNNLDGNNLNQNEIRKKDNDNITMQQSQHQPLGQQNCTSSATKNNQILNPENNNFYIDSESKFIFGSYQFLDPLRESQKYKIGQSSIQNRLFRKTKKKMQNTRLKILSINQNTFEIKQ